MTEAISGGIASLLSVARNDNVTTLDALATVLQLRLHQTQEGRREHHDPNNSLTRDVLTWRGFYNTVARSQKISEETESSELGNPGEPLSASC